MKAINEPVTVEARSGVPCRLRWDRSTYRTRKLLDYWILQTRWWGQEERRIYFRLETDGGVMEVYRTTTGVEEKTRKAAEEGATPDARYGGGDASVRHAAPRPPLPIEGDTHTRERRRTDAVYRPDVRVEEAGRPASRSSATGTYRWMLSKIVD